MSALNLKSSTRKLIPILIAFSLVVPSTSSAGLFRRMCIRLIKEAGQVIGGSDFREVKTFQHEGTAYIETTDPKVITSGTLVEGSVKSGGMQPHYRIDLDKPEYKTLIEEAKNLTGSQDEKVEWIIKQAQKAFPERSYFSPEYLKINAKSLWNGTPVSLSSYLQGGAGVCRENALLTKVLLDSAGIKSRIRYVETWRVSDGVRIVEDHQLNLVMKDSEWVIVDPFFSIYNGRNWREVNTPEGLSHTYPGTTSTVQFGITKTHDFPIYYVPNNPVPAKEFSVTWKNGYAQRFEVMGRSTAEKSFAAEAELIEKAAPTDLVPMEWLFMPLYGYTGHTAVRVGDALYDFGSNGWVILDEGQKNARAYLFNNPVLKRNAVSGSSASQYPYSLGIPLSVEKSVLVEWMAKIEKEKADGNAFSFLTNNCNHSALRGLRKTCPNFAGMKFDQFDQFSSALTFKKLAKQAGLKQDKIRVYPLPGHTSTLSMQERLPYYLEPDHSKWNEATRIIYEGVKEKLYNLLKSDKSVTEAITPPLRSIP